MNDLLKQIIAGNVSGIAPESQPAPKARTLAEIPTADEDEKNKLLGNRWLCRGGQALLAAETGCGKSSWIMQAMVLWGLNRPAFGIAPIHAMRSLYIQAENDDGDLREMRDGIFDGLDLSAEDRQTAAKNVLWVTEEARTGAAFWATVVDPLLTEHKPDLCAIDPVLHYLGGENNSQKDVGAFVRDGGLVTFRKHRCGGILLHHPNKPKDEKSYNASYSGAGSAEWANACRAILAIYPQQGDEYGKFQLKAGKRSQRLGWLDSIGNRSNTRAIAHSGTDQIYWRDDTGESAAFMTKQKPGRRSIHEPSDLLEFLGADRLSYTDFGKRALEIGGWKEGTFKAKLKILKKDGLVVVGQDQLYEKAPPRIVFKSRKGQEGQEGQYGAN